MSVCLSQMTNVRSLGLRPLVMNFRSTLAISLLCKMLELLVEKIVINTLNWSLTLGLAAQCAFEGDKVLILIADSDLETN